MWSKCVPLADHEDGSSRRNMSPCGGWNWSGKISQKKVGVDARVQVSPEHWSGTRRVLLALVTCQWSWCCAWSVCVYAVFFMWDEIKASTEDHETGFCRTQEQGLLVQRSSHPEVLNFFIQVSVLPPEETKKVSVWISNLDLMKHSHPYMPLVSAWTRWELLIESWWDWDLTTAHCSKIFL